MNNGESPDPPEGGMPGTGTDAESKPLFPFATAILVLLAGILLGMLFSWVVRPTPDEQLSSAHARIAEQDNRIRALQGALDRVDPIVRNMALHEQSIADREAALAAREAIVARREQELASRWSIPKPNLTSEHVSSFFQRADDSISRLLDGKDVQGRPCRC